ncbi:hypothetical protein LXL04_035752 [Taraxacum kok-saghyz]
MVIIHEEKPFVITSGFSPKTASKSFCTRKSSENSGTKLQFSESSRAKLQFLKLQGPNCKFSKLLQYCYSTATINRRVAKMKHQLHLLRIILKIDFVDESFIHKGNTCNIYASKAYNFVIHMKDSHMVVDKMENRKLHFPNFSRSKLMLIIILLDFLGLMILRSEITKNFEALVDHHKGCVTFAAGLLSLKTADAYAWLFEEFRKAFVIQPMMIATHQVSSMKKTVSLIPIEVYNYPDFQMTFYDICSRKFESNWSTMINKFDIYQRTRGFDANYPENINYALSHFLHHKPTFVKFMMSFDSAMEKQMHHQSY